MPFNEGNMLEGGAEKEKDEKREMGDEEVMEMGEEMDDIYGQMIEDVKNIQEELKEPGISEERASKLRETLEVIKMQLGEEWEGFAGDAKSGDFSEPKIDK